MLKATVTEKIMTENKLTHLKRQLKPNSIHIMREVAAEV